MKSASSGPWESGNMGILLVSSYSVVYSFVVDPFRCASSDKWVSGQRTSHGRVLVCYVALLVGVCPTTMGSEV